MKSFERYIPILRSALDDYQKKHPHWRVEVLVSLIKWGIKSLRHYVEDPQERNITWESPFVELHYPVEWNWRPRNGGDIAPGGHIFGKITARNTATKEIAAKTLGKIMTQWFNATTLAEVTNWAWYERLRNYQTPVLPAELAVQLNAIKNKSERRKAFDELVRPFCIGAMPVDLEGLEIREGNRVPKKATNQLAKPPNALGIQSISISGDINGRVIKMFLIFEVRPLVADYSRKKAFHPITIGVFIEPEVKRGEVVTRTPAKWPKKDRELLWEEIQREFGRAVDSLVPKPESEASIILTVNARIKIPAEKWRPENRGEAIREITELQSKAGELVGLTVANEESGIQSPRKETCPVCGWTHDVGFTQISIQGVEMIFLRGVLTEIVRLVHRAHERGLGALSTKEQALKEACGGYHHSCKAFDDLNRREEYKRLFDTSRRGFIALRGAVGINRDKSEARPE